MRRKKKVFRWPVGRLELKRSDRAIAAAEEAFKRPATFTLRTGDEEKMAKASTDPIPPANGESDSL
jgi:hypothetical protein